jgi:hypothetical protein
MEANKEQITEAVQVRADALAAKLGMQREEEVTSLHEDESAMIVTAEGITTGKVTVMYGEMSATRYKYFYLNDELLFEEQYNLYETGWGTEPTVTGKLPKEAILYKR